MLLQVHDLQVAYARLALHGISLDIEPGEIVALIGSNGAGKTTLLRTISGLLRPAAGSIRWNARQPAMTESTIGAGAGAAVESAGSTSRGPASVAEPVDLHRLPPHEIVRLGISHVPEGRQIFPDLTVQENLLLGGYPCDDPHAISEGIERSFQLFPILAERRRQRAGTLSGGEQQMLAIGRALMARPALLLLDEPSLGLAPLIVRRIFEIIQAINAQGTTIFLVEQNARMALTVAGRGYVLQTGNVILSGPASTLLGNDDVQRAYLGG